MQAIKPATTGFEEDTYTVDRDKLSPRQLQMSARIYLDRIADRLQAEGLRVRTEVVVEWPAAAILEYARAYQVDLITMATHGRSGVARLLLGSVADKVMRGAPIPVLLHRQGL